MVSLRAFECLIAVADTGSITQAARLLFLSQPAVSHHVSVLEREAGTALLLRESRGVRLTPAGRAAARDARRSVEAAQSALRSAQQVGAGEAGALRLACVQSLVFVLAPVMGRWHQKQPQVALTLRESTSMTELMGLVDADEVDMLVVPGPAPERFTATDVTHEEIVVVTPADHPLTAQPSVTFADLHGRPLVHYSTQNDLGLWLDDAFARAQVKPRPIVRTSVTGAAAQLAAAGMGVAVCPVSALGATTSRQVRSFAPRWLRTLVAVTPSDPDPLAARFINDLRHQYPAELPIAESGDRH